MHNIRRWRAYQLVSRRLGKGNTKILKIQGMIQMTKAIDFISDIYTHGITKQIIDKYKDSFSDFFIVIHEEEKFIQVNEAVIRFNEAFDSSIAIMFTTTKDFPDDDSLALLCDNYQEFHDFVVYETSSVVNSGRILESMLPREGIFYIYNDELIVDYSSMRKVYLSSGGYSDAQSIASGDTMAHTSFWTNYMIKDFPELQGKNYMSIPRGRIFYSDNEFKIFLDKSYINNTTIKSKIEKEFRLSRARGYTINYVESLHYDYTKYS